MDADLDRLISRRASQDRGPDPDEQEPGYLESVRRHRERERREIGARWYGHHEHMREVHERLAREHAEKAEALLCTVRRDGVSADPDNQGRA